MSQASSLRPAQILLKLSFNFFISLIIIDEDDEVTQDELLAINVEFKNYGRLGTMPIRTALA